MVSKGALSGLKIVELATMVSGPYCGKLLADLGADVIKVEPPDGDPSRLCSPFPKGNQDKELSALFLYNNTSKRGITPDLVNQGSISILKHLIGWADVLIDNHPPGYLENVGLDWKTIHKINPSLVFTSITPYGRTGPRSDVNGDELTLIQAAGLGNLLPPRSVNINRPPVKMGGYAVGYSGGVTAALATMGAIFHKIKTGRGQLIDISLQEVILNLVRPIVSQSYYENITWSRVPDRPPSMGRVKVSDGYVVMRAENEDHHFKAFLELMGNPEWASAPEWLDRAYRTQHLPEIAPKINKWMSHQKKDDIYYRAGKKGIPIGPVNSAKDVMSDEQYKARKYFLEINHPKAGKLNYAGWPYKMTVTPPKACRPAPLLGEHNREIIDNLPLVSEHPKQARISTTGNSLPLKGVRIADFGWAWAGPSSTMFLASLGAEVIKIEGHRRMDTTRRNVVWPLSDEKPTVIKPNQSMSFNSVNMSKKSITLDLSKPEGVEIAKRIVAISDVVVDNLRAGAMKRMGLDYEALRRLKSNLIVISISSRGQEGPQKDFSGYATIHHAIGGGAYITGYSDDAPSHSVGDTDIMNGVTAAFIILSALYHRMETGDGQFIDYSQCEGVSSLNGVSFLGYQMTGEPPERMGNAHPQYAPHNLYKCWGVDRWVALEIHSDREFSKLVGVIGQPELTKDSRFASMPARKKNELALDKIITDWTSQRDRDWIAGEFIKAGLTAAPSRDARDLYSDPHLKARKAFVTIDNPEIGKRDLVGMPWCMSETSPELKSAPMLGEHNNYVLKDLLGLKQAEVDELRRKDIIL